MIVLEGDTCHLQLLRRPPGGDDNVRRAVSLRCYSMPESSAGSPNRSTTLAGENGVKKLELRIELGRLLRVVGDIDGLG